MDQLIKRKRQAKSPSPDVPCPSSSCNAPNPATPEPIDTNLPSTVEDLEMSPCTSDVELPSLEDAQWLLAALEEPRNVLLEVHEALYCWRSQAEDRQETQVNDDEHVMDVTGSEEDGEAFEFDYAENNMAENVNT
jgi:hypothetical protein